MALKISLMESLKEVKYCFVWKVWRGLGERIGSAYLLKAGYPGLDLGKGGGFVWRL